MNVMRTLNNHSHSSTGSGQQHDQIDMQTVHIPVLLQQVLDNLNLKSGNTVLDATVGGGGHASSIARLIGKSGTFIGIDADSQALKRVKAKLETFKCNKFLIQENFRNLDKVLNDLNIDNLDGALFDLGLSSDQLEVSGRGFTFQHSEPLTMTLNDIVGEDTLTAREIVNNWAEESLADIIYGYGGERYARRIAKAIVKTREEKEINKTEELADIIRGAVPASYRHGRINCATKTFQALRITVNDELGAIKEALCKVLSKLNNGGRVAVITFHSLEDRLIKRMFKQWQTEGYGVIITKKPIVPTEEEISNNKRARSSKLRVFEKYKN